MAKFPTARIGFAIVVVGLFVASPWCCGFGQFFLGPIIDDWTNRCAFDSQKWIGAEGTILRNDMVYDLESNHPLIGKTETEVTAMLGKPTDMAPGTKYPNFGSDQVWEYLMGKSHHTIGPDPEIFLVGFRDGKVVNISLRRS